MAIESEEKKKQLTVIIEYWARHIKVDSLLRDGDIPNLVSQILNEFYSIVFGCGHRGHWNDGVDIAFKSIDNGEPCIIQGLYCRDCAERYKRELGAWEIKEEEEKEDA